MALWWLWSASNYILLHFYWTLLSFECYPILSYTYVFLDFVKLMIAKKIFIYCPYIIIKKFDRKLKKIHFRSIKQKSNSSLCIYLCIISSWIFKSYKNKILHLNFLSFSATAHRTYINWCEAIGIIYAPQRLFPIYLYSHFPNIPNRA